MITDYIPNAILYSFGALGVASQRKQITTTPPKMPLILSSSSSPRDESCSPLSPEKQSHVKIAQHSRSSGAILRSFSPDCWTTRDRAYSDASSRSRSSATSSMQQQARQQEERLSKNRKTINGHLKKVSYLAGGKDKLKLDPNTGMCCFPYRRFIIVLEVPSDRPGHLYVYTCVCRLEKGDHRVKVMEKAMQLNFMQNATRGSTLGVDGDEVNLCFSIPIAGIQAATGDLRVVMEDFMQTALEANEQLVRAKRR
jgi:Tir chaperone protein (CesT) family